MSPALRLRVAGAVAACAAAGALAFAPTPNTPVYAGLSGALPSGFHYAYADTYTGWPVAPVHAQHPVRGSFLDPRGVDDTGTSGYHFGVDVSIDDARPEAGAPPLLSHRVYAVESGRVDQPNANLARPCLDRRLEVGHFDYWHVSPIVKQGQQVRAGQQIGWSCLGVWHVHVSEWQQYQGVRVWVNPLHRGGKLRPYSDTAPPVVYALAFNTPPARPWVPTTSLAQPDSSQTLLPSALHGQVDLRAQVGDPQSYLGFLSRNPNWPTVFSPYAMAVTIRSGATGAVVLRKRSFQADQLPQTAYVVHYAPGTIEDENMQECVRHPPTHGTCAGVYWLRPLSGLRLAYWNTRSVPNGVYHVTVQAFDLAGNTGSRTVAVTVKN